MTTLRVATLEALNSVINVSSNTCFDLPGSIVQVQTARSGPARQTISSSDPVLVDGLSITFTPRFTDSLIVVDAHVTSTATYVSSYSVYRDGQPTVSTVGQTNNSYNNMHITLYNGDNDPGDIYSHPLMHFESADSTASRTYAIYGLSKWSGTTYTEYVNNRSSNDMASFSHMVIMEVKT